MQSDQFHFLHHARFECNYGSGSVPLDSWFGTFREALGESKSYRGAARGASGAAAPKAKVVARSRGRACPDAQTVGVFGFTAACFALLAHALHAQAEAEAAGQGPGHAAAARARGGRDRRVRPLRSVLPAAPCPRRQTAGVVAVSQGGRAKVQPALCDRVRRRCAAVLLPRGGRASAAGGGRVLPRLGLLNSTL